MSIGKSTRNNVGRINETTTLLMENDDEENRDYRYDMYHNTEYSDDDLGSSDGSENNALRMSSKDESEGKDKELLPLWTIICILSSSFAYGCIMTTLFLITLPIECERIEKQNPNIPKSVSSVMYTNYYFGKLSCRI